jgi:hypothetical protein
MKEKWEGGEVKQRPERKFRLKSYMLQRFHSERNPLARFRVSEEDMVDARQSEPFNTTLSFGEPLKDHMSHHTMWGAATDRLTLAVEQGYS